MPIRRLVAVRPPASRRATAQARTKQALLDAGRSLRSRDGYRATSIEAMLASLEAYLMQSATEVDWGALVIELRTGTTGSAPLSEAPTSAITQLFIASHKRLPVAADDLADAFIAMSKGFALRRRVESHVDVVCETPIHEET